MRSVSIATAAAAVLVVAVGCKGKDSATNDALARDITLAESSSGLTLAPRAGSQAVVSAQELSPQARPHVAPSSRASHPVAHRTPRRDRVPAQAQQVAAVADPAPASEPSVAVAPTAAPAPEQDAGPVAESPRPHPVNVQYPASGGGGDVGSGRSGGGIGIGDVIGILGGVVLRGGVADGDHCDPRGGRHGGGNISINQRGPILRGRF